MVLHHVYQQLGVAGQACTPWTVETGEAQLGLGVDGGQEDHLVLLHLVLHQPLPGQEVAAAPHWGTSWQTGGPLQLLHRLHIRLGHVALSHCCCVLGTGLPDSSTALPFLLTGASDYLHLDIVLSQFLCSAAIHVLEITEPSKF